MKNIKTISIKCDCKDFLKLEDMTVMQGNLKERNDTDYEKIKKSILTYSFSFPFFIWKNGKTNYLIDGTGRHSCLLRMQEEGYIIPDLPVVYVDCKDKNEAKQKLLRLNSQYGHMTKESVLDFAEGLDLNFDEISLPDTTIDFFNDVEECEFPELEEGDKTSLSQMTFTLSADQVETIKSALRKCENVENPENQNMNGNKLALICTRFLYD